MPKNGKRSESPMSAKPAKRPQRGEVWWVRFDPSVGEEIRKTRPAIVVSNNMSNRYLNRFQVVPLSTQTGKLYPSEALVHFAGQRSKAMADQITTASLKRFQSRIGEIDHDGLQELRRILLLQLGL